MSVRAGELEMRFFALLLSCVTVTVSAIVSGEGGSVSESLDARPSLTLRTDSEVLPASPPPRPDSKMVLRGRTCRRAMTNTYLPSPDSGNMDREDVAAKLSEAASPYLDRVMDMLGAPFAREMGIGIESVDLDRVECSMTLLPEHMNSMGRGHGAAIYALLDHTFAIAANLIHDCTGQSSEVKFYRPASGRLRAVCVPVNRSRSLEAYDVRVLSEEGKLIASAICTAFVIRRD